MPFKKKSIYFGDDIVVYYEDIKYLPHELLPSITLLVEAEGNPSKWTRWGLPDTGYLGGKGFSSSEISDIGEKIKHARAVLIPEAGQLV